MQEDLNRYAGFNMRRRELQADVEDLQQALDELIMAMDEINRIDPDDQDFKWIPSTTRALQPLRLHPHQHPMILICVLLQQQFQPSMPEGNKGKYQPLLSSARSEKIAITFF